VRILFDRVDRNLLKLRVEDGGPGVTPSDLLRIFAEPPVHTLSRVRDLLRLHGSELRVTNVPAGGASFYFTLALVEEGTDSGDAAEGGGGEHRLPPGSGSPPARG
jgi:K+-sensing histidine kinase KdpD